MYKFGTLNLEEIRHDPLEANKALFASGPVYGIEVTVPSIAERCTWNLGPKHTGANADYVAIEEAMRTVLPFDKSTLVTVRPDLDSVGSMAVLNLRFKGKNLKPAEGRITMVATWEKFTNRKWVAHTLPTKENPWPQGYEIAPLIAMVSDPCVSMAERVDTMEQWLMGGKEPAKYRQQVEAERTAFISALEGGEIAHRVVADGRIAVVKTSHPAALSVGYALAPVVILCDPAVWLDNDEPHLKFTVFQFSEGFVKLRAAFAELSRLESGWNLGAVSVGFSRLGSGRGCLPTICSSSRDGVSSTLTTDEVVEVVERHLI